jgi:hypothetical protein
MRRLDSAASKWTSSDTEPMLVPSVGCMLRNDTSERSAEDAASNRQQKEKKRLIMVLVQFFIHSGVNACFAL